MKQLLAALLATLALGLVAVGCGGDDDDGNGGNGGNGGAAATTEQQATTEKKQASGGDAAGGGKPVEIEVVDIDYDPKDATVEQGVTVRWTNTGNLPHTVTKDSGPGADFDSGTMQPGDTFEQTFDTAGEIGYLCTIHSGQNGTLTVQ